MNNKDITAALAALEEATFLLEEEYMENGGEVTEETEEQEQYIEQLKALLEDEGIDSLGRWLKSKEDLIKTLKAERDSVTRQIKKTEEGIDFIKSRIHEVLTALGKDKVKGTFYSFAPTMSVKTEVNKEYLNEKYALIVNEALEEFEKKHKVHLPEWVSFSLGASVAAFKAVTNGECPLPGEFKVTETPSCKFVKPRAKREE